MGHPIASLSRTHLSTNQNKRESYRLFRFSCVFIIFMAKIFYCGGSSGRLGILRAVIPVSDLSGVLSPDIPKYVGKSFPKMKLTGPSRTVIEVAPDEKHGQ